jgi:hypothetical protein
MADVITCPSGLTGRVRATKVREERVLVDRKLAQSGGQIDELLAACWEETLDAGPYTLGEGGKLDLGKATNSNAVRSESTAVVCPSLDRRGYTGTFESS